MTREFAQKILPLIEAFSQGKTIQSRLANSSGVWGEWSDEDSPTFSFHDYREYRIKPEPREWYLTPCVVDASTLHAHETLESAKMCHAAECEGFEPIKVREVIE